MGLPQFWTETEALNLLQSRWAAILDPIIANEATNPVILKNIVLSSSSIINHTLGRKLVGWEIIRQRGDASIYDRQDINASPDKTLLLTSSSGISVDILCF